MYQNIATNSLTTLQCPITASHAAGIRKSIERSIAERLLKMTRRPVSPRYQICVRATRKRMLSLFGTAMSSEVIGDKRRAAWVFVTKDASSNFTLNLLSMTKTNHGVRSVVQRLPVVATNHFFERLIQQHDGESPSLASIMVESLADAKHASIKAVMNRGQNRTCRIAIATDGGLILGEWADQRVYVLRTFISASRLIEKRSLWCALRRNGGFGCEVSSANGLEWKFAA